MANLSEELKNKLQHLGSEPIFIGLGHRKSVGKDTFANFAMSYCVSGGVSAQRIAFADKVRSTAYQLFSYAGMPTPIQVINDPTLKNAFLPLIGKTVRQIYIELGCKMREIHPSLWVNLALNDIGFSKINLITDVRFMNEVEAIRQRKGFLIKIVRPDVPITNDEADDALEEYVGWDHVVENNGSLKDLYSEVIKCLQGIL